MKLFYAYIVNFLNVTILFSAFVMAIVLLCVGAISFIAWDFVMPFEFVLILSRICLVVGVVGGITYMFSPECKQSAEKYVEKMNAKGK